MKGQGRKKIRLRVRGLKNVDTLKVEVPVKHLTKDEGSFTFGYCRSCDWRGPGRRARDKARADAAAHHEQCPGKGKVVVTSGTPVKTAAGKLKP